MGERIKRWRWAILITALLLAGLAYAFWPAATPVDVAQVSRGPMSVGVTDDGVTRAEDYYVVSAPVTGYLSRIELEPGDPVAPGTLIEESALRQQILLLAREGELQRFDLLAEQYSRRFPKSLFALNFRRQFFAGVARQTYKPASEWVQRTETELMRAPASERVGLYLAIADEATKGGSVDIARFAARVPAFEANAEYVDPIILCVNGGQCRLRHHPALYRSARQNLNERASSPLIQRPYIPPFKEWGLRPLL